MEIDNNFIQNLLEKARQNPRLRQNFDLRNGSEDQSQRALNALLPGTIVPIHRHTQTTETVLAVYGSLVEVFYNDKGEVIERHVLGVNGSSVGLQIPIGQWHTVEVTEPCVIFEAKDGAYAPSLPTDILNV